MRTNKVFDLKKAVESDVTGLAEAVVDAFHAQKTKAFEMTAVVDRIDKDPYAYTVTCSAIEGIKVVEMLVDGRWNLGANFILQNDGRWVMKAFSFDPKKGTEVTGTRVTSEPIRRNAHLTGLAKKLEKITAECAWGDPREPAQIVSRHGSAA